MVVIQIPSIKAVIFDFDGVIAESMDIKTKAFEHVFRDYPEDIVKKVVQLHLDNGGMSRFKKFQIAYRDYIKKELTKETEEMLGKEFSKFVFEKMISCPYVKGAKEFIEKHHQNYKFFIVSGTPHEEINEIVDQRGLRPYFLGVWGTPRKKGELIKMILAEYGYKQDEAVFIGDAPNDYIGAKEAGIIFIARIAPGVYNPFVTDDFEINYSIENLLFLENLITSRLEQ